MAIVKCEKVFRKELMDNLFANVVITNSANFNTNNNKGTLLFLPHTPLKTLGLIYHQKVKKIDIILCCIYCFIYCFIYCSIYCSIYCYICCSISCFFYCSIACFIHCFIYCFIWVTPDCMRVLQVVSKIFWRYNSGYYYT